MNNPLNAQVQWLQYRIKRLELAIDISKRFSGTLEVDKLMATILDSVTTALGAEACSFWMVTSQTEQISCHVAAGPTKDKVLGMELKMGSGIVGWVIENKQNAVLFDASKDERFNRTIDNESGFITKSMLCVPLVVNGECSGAIQLLNKRTQNGQFNQEDLEMLELLAVNAAIAIKNALLYSSERKIKELNLVLEISNQIVSTLDLDRVLLAVVTLGAQVVHYKRAVIGLLNSSNNLVLSAESHVAEPDPSSASNKQLHKIMDYVFESGRSLHIENFIAKESYENIPEFICDYLREHELRCLSVILLQDSEGRLGLLSMEGVYARLTGSDSKYLITLLVNQATMAIRNAQLYQKLPTGGLVGRLESAVQKSQYSTKQLSVAGVALTSLLALLFFLPFPHYLSLDVELIPVHTSQVTARLEGVVKAVHFQEGDYVKKGQVLLEFDRTDLELQKAKLLAAREIAQKDLRRLESEQNASEAQLKLLEIIRLQADLNMLKGKLSSAFLAASESGRILTADPDELLNKQATLGQRLADIAAGDQKRGRVMIPEDEILAITPKMSVAITLKATPDRHYSGVLSSVAHTRSDAEESSGYYAYISSEELQEEHVRLGMTGKTKIHMGKRSLFQRHLKKPLQRGLTWLRLTFRRQG